MADDPIKGLAVAVAADHQASKRKRGAKAAAAGDEAAQEATEAGSTVDEAAALGEVVEGAVAEAIKDEGRPSVVAERIENIAADAAIDTGTMVGDLRDVFLDLFKTRPKPWSAMTEDEQRQVAAALTHAARDLVTTAVQLVSEAGNGAFMAKLEKYADGGGLKIALTAESTTENVLACHAAQGQFVMVSRYDPKPFSGERRGVQVDPDEPEIVFDGDKPDAPVKPPEGDTDLAGDDPFGGDSDPGAEADVQEPDADLNPDVND